MNSFRLLSLFFCCTIVTAIVQAKAPQKSGVKIDSFFNENTLLNGVSYLSQTGFKYDQFRATFKTIKPYKSKWMRGEQVQVKFLDNQRYPNLKTIDMPQAYVDESRSWLFSNQGCWFKGEQFQSFSQGAVINIELERGLFLGKTTSYYYQDSSTHQDEQSQQSNLEASRQIPNQTQLEPENTDKESIDSLPRQPQAISIQKPSIIPDIYRDFLVEGAQLNKDFEIQKQQALTVFSKQDYNQVAAVSASDIKQTATRTEQNKEETASQSMVVENENGVFIDQKSGYIIYYGPVKLTHPEYELTCTGDLQLKIAQKNEKKKGEKESSKGKKDKTGLEYAKAQGKVKLIASTEENGEIKKIIATGKIIEIFGKEESIKVQGDYPTLTQSGSKLIAKEESLSYQINREGSLTTSRGPWKTEILELDKLSN